MAELLFGSGTEMQIDRPNLVHHTPVGVAARNFFLNNLSIH